MQEMQVHRPRSAAGRVVLRVWRESEETPVIWCASLMRGKYVGYRLLLETHGGSHGQHVMSFRSSHLTLNAALRFARKRLPYLAEGAGVGANRRSLLTGWVWFGYSKKWPDGDALMGRLDQLVRRHFPDISGEALSWP